MEKTTGTDRHPILEKAWLHHAELDTHADRLSGRYLQLRRWVAILGVLATFLAIFIDTFGEARSVEMQALLKVFLIATPLLASMIAAYTSHELGDGRWLSLRAGAEEIKKEIYIYRTVLRGYPDRNKWLSSRLAVIQRQVYKSSNSKLDTIPYTGTLPLYLSPDNPESDPGFMDLTPEAYIRYRLQQQLTWHENRIVSHSKAKRNLTIIILAMGALGALLAGIGGPFTVWVALTASLTGTLTGWEELRNREKTIANYSKVKLELTIIRDFWYGLSPAEQTDSAFYRLVLATENLMFAQNAEWVRSMQEALAGVEDEDKKLVEEMVQMSTTTHADLQQKLLSESQAVFAHASQQLATVAEDAAATVTGMVTAVSDEALAMNQTMAHTVDTAVAESAAVRQTITETVDTAAASATAAREAAATEVKAWQDTSQTAVDTAVAELAALRNDAETAVEAAADTTAAARQLAAAEAHAWDETTQEALQSAAAESAALRHAADQATLAAAAQAEAWRKSAQEAVDAAATESDAWRESAAEVVDTAVAESAALRASAEMSVKYAIDFTPVADAVAETAVAAHETLAEVVYQAQPDVKYAINFLTAASEGAAVPAPDDDNNDKDDEAINRILAEGVTTADDVIKEALAKAAKSETRQKN